MPAGQIRVVPGSADLQRFQVTVSRPEARARLGWPADRRVHRLGAAAGAPHRRRPPDRGDAGDCRRASPTPRSTSAAPARCSRPCASASSDLGLDERVTLPRLRPRRAAALVYRAADLNVMPTTALEGFGLTVVEALAAGTPSIVTPIGGLPEIVAPLAPDLVLRSAEVPEIARGVVDALAGRLWLPGERECRAFAAEPLLGRPDGQSCRRRLRGDCREAAMMLKDAAKQVLGKSRSDAISYRRRLSAYGDAYLKNLGWDRIGREPSGRGPSRPGAVDHLPGAADAGAGGAAAFQGVRVRRRQLVAVVGGASGRGGERRARPRLGAGRWPPALRPTSPSCRGRSKPNRTRAGGRSWRGSWTRTAIRR